MKKRVKKFTVYRYVDWWLLELFFLFLLASSTVWVLVNPTYQPFVGSMLSRLYLAIIVFLGTVFLIILALRATDVNERMAFLLIVSMFIITYSLPILIESEFMFCVYLIAFALSSLAYYYVRRAGQLRRLNFIKTPFGSKGSKSLFINVVFLEVIAITVGLDIYLCVYAANRVLIFSLGLLASSLGGGVFLYAVFKVFGWRVFTKKFALIFLVWVIVMLLFWIAVVRNISV
jgi:hypothetical protein